MSNITELNAKWLADQRKIVSSEIKKLSEMMVEYTLTSSDTDKFSIHFELSSTHYEVRVHDRSFKQICKADSWCINSVLDHYLILDKKEVSANIKKLIDDIKQMQFIVREYVKLNKP